MRARCWDPALESQAQVDEIAAAVAAAGASILRGCVQAEDHRIASLDMASRRSPGSQAADRYDMAVVTEVMSEADVGLVGSIADLLRVGSRNMQNFALLRAVGMSQPVLLKRDGGDGRGVAARRGASPGRRGSGRHLLCAHQRPTRTRNLLDLGAVALLSAPSLRRGRSVTTGSTTHPGACESLARCRCAWVDG